MIESRSNYKRTKIELRSNYNRSTIELQSTTIDSKLRYITLQCNYDYVTLRYVKFSVTRTVVICVSMYLIMVVEVDSKP